MLSESQSALQLLIRIIIVYLSVALKEVLTKSVHVLCCPVKMNVLFYLLCIHAVSSLITPRLGHDCVQQAHTGRQFLIFSTAFQLQALVNDILAYDTGLRKRRCQLTHSTNGGKFVTETQLGVSFITALMRLLAADIKPKSFELPETELLLPRGWRASCSRACLDSSK